MKARKLEFHSKNLLLTERGESWLACFRDEDKQTARDLVAGLTLISATEFERGLVKALEDVAHSYHGRVALFAVREVPKDIPLFVDSSSQVDATPSGADIGSEGRIAALIRNLTRSDKKKFLNHPTIEEMRTAKCDAVIFVDDFVGSGQRVSLYLESFYANPTIKSWYSYHKFSIDVVAYSAANSGIRTVKNNRLAPSMTVVRSCPTIETKLTWSEETRERIVGLCFKYSNELKMRMPLGYKNTGALIIFEHSCPNNCPQILWGNSKAPNWSPLFREKTVASDARDVFPPEMTAHTPSHMLINAGAARLAAKLGDSFPRPLPVAWVAILALFQKGVSHVEAVESATGLDNKESLQAIEKCISFGLISQKLRLTDLGRRELHAYQKISIKNKKTLPNDKEQYYYPRALRRFDDF